MVKAGQIGDDALEIVDAMHAEIELLMLSGGYTRDVAVKMLLSKVAKEKAMQERQAAVSVLVCVLFGTASTDCIIVFSVGNALSARRAQQSCQQQQ